MTEQEIQQAELAAIAEHEAAMRQITARLDRPVTTAEYLNPQLLLEGIDFGALDRADAAIEKLEAAGVERVRNHAAVLNGLNPSFSTTEAREIVRHVRELAKRFDPLRKKGGRS